MNLSETHSYENDDYDYRVTEITYTIIGGNKTRALHIGRNWEKTGTSFYIEHDKELRLEERHRSPPGKVVGYVKEKDFARFKEIADSTAVPEIPNLTHPSLDDIFNAWKQNVLDNAKSNNCFEVIS